MVAGLVMAGCGQTRKEKVAAKLDKKVDETKIEETIFLIPFTISDPW